MGLRLQLHLLVGEDGRQRLIAHAGLQHLRTHAVDRLDAQQAVVLLVVLGHAHLAIDHVAGLQANAPNLRVGDVDVILARQIVPGAQEAHCLLVVLDDLQHAATEVVAARLGVDLHDAEDEVLLLHRRVAGDLHVAADVAQLAQFFAFQFTDIHTLLLFGAVAPVGEVHSGRLGYSVPTILFAGLPNESTPHDYIAMPLAVIIATTKRPAPPAACRGKQPSRVNRWIKAGEPGQAVR